MSDPQRRIPDLVELHNLFKANKKEKVFDSLLEIADNTEDKQLRKHILMLSSEWNNYNTRRISGTMSVEDDQIALRNLNTRILDLIERIPAETSLKIKRKVHEKIDKKEDPFDLLLTRIFKVLSLLLFVASIAGTVFFVINGAEVVLYVLCILGLILPPVIFVLLRKFG